MAFNNSFSHQNEIKEISEHDIDSCINEKLMTCGDDKKLEDTLIESCYKGRKDIVELLLTKGVDISACDTDGKTVLMCAVENGHEHVLHVLAKHGVDVNAQDKFGVTALTLACRLGNVNIVELLIKSFADIDINVCNRFGETALIISCRQGHEQIVKLVLDYIINKTCDNLDRCDLLGKTALMYLCENGCEKMVELLLQCGADVNATGRFGKTALMFSHRMGQDKIVELLLRRRASVYAKDKFGMTALMLACEFGNVKFVELFLQHGANIDTTSKTQMSALMLAARAGDVDCVRSLIAAGASLDLIDSQQCTVFSYALRGNGNCLEVLLDNGNLLSDGILKPVHRNANNSNSSWQALLVSIKYGVFQWEWCPHEYYTKFAFTVLSSGFCPGKIKYYDLNISPLLLSFLKDDIAVVNTYLSSLYYFPEDYRILSTRNNVSVRIRNRDRLDKFIHTPLSLQTWSLLTVSKAISLTGPPGLRGRRVNSLPIPEVLKQRLKFEIYDYNCNQETKDSQLEGDLYSLFLWCRQLNRLPQDE